jgi:hypothetical protein
MNSMLFGARADRLRAEVGQLHERIVACQHCQGAVTRLCGDCAAVQAQIDEIDDVRARRGAFGRDVQCLDMLEDVRGLLYDEIGAA